MSHPDPNAPADLRPWQVGDELVNPVTGEYARLLEIPWQNPEGRARAELLARPGARVVGEHLHPGIVERFTVLDGELTVRLDGTTQVLPEGETAAVRPGDWHDWWNATDRDIRVLVKVTPAARFVHMIETMFGLARLGHVNDQGMPDLLQMAMIGREFSDVMQCRSPPAAMQKALFTALAPSPTPSATGAPTPSCPAAWSRRPTASLGRVSPIGERRRVRVRLRACRDLRC